MQRAFKAVPVPGLAAAGEAVSIVAETDLAALLRATQMLGGETSFDLFEGGRLVVIYRPTRTPHPVWLEAE